MYTKKIRLRVRYADTDKMGYVYYGNYAAYYEVARVETFRSLGHSYKLLEESGVMMPVLEMKCSFIKPAKYDDYLSIKASIPELPKVKIKFNYDIYNEQGEHLNEGFTTLVFINIKTGKPTRIPNIMKELLLPYFKDEENEIDGQDMNLGFDVG